MSLSLSRKKRRFVVRTQSLHLDYTCLDLGNLAVSQPSYFLLMTRQPDIGRSHDKQSVFLYIFWNVHADELLRPEQRPEEEQLDSPFGVDAERTDNGERLLHLCADHCLFLASTNFQTNAHTQLLGDHLPQDSCGLNWTIWLSDTDGEPQSIIVVSSGVRNLILITQSCGLA
ncbi:hypothetical protein T265_10907 [Opisthorchis viverrini]|uniref:Uncharacterized protein n=1 Tax=Opisthorchis viverrini TaxID=6198 RepID=A0A074ZZF5_OPIVI|nr:hypothetical protein T265_10907 [Opisthorchis viverrini]KER20559.1 hypothetical protein T265_10907 [Opisthorchis viverrini]